MFLRMIKGAVFRQKNRMLILLFTIFLGTTLATGMLNVVYDVGDKINRELKTYGANINIISRDNAIISDLYGMDDSNMDRKYLKESDLPKIKGIFWSHNIVDFAPYLEFKSSILNAEGTKHAESEREKADAKERSDQSEVKVIGTWFHKEFKSPTGEEYTTGIQNLKTWWHLDGEFLKDDESPEILVGTTLAQTHEWKIGDDVELQAKDGKSHAFTIKGIFKSGSVEDGQIYTSMQNAYLLSGLSDSVSRVELSALTTPDNELARRAAQNPKSLSLTDFDTWYCTAYVSSICYQVEGVIPDAIAKPIRQVAESEGEILNKTKLIMLLITGLTLISSALAISNLISASVIERSKEIGLLKALGAQGNQIVLKLLVEIISISAIGVLSGYVVGTLFANFISLMVFGSKSDLKLVVLPIVSFLIFVVVLLGSLPAIRNLLRLKPAEVLHGR